jgi:hypothetical protein
MKRRALLTAMTASPLVLAAGCTTNDPEDSDSSEQSCRGVEITEASVSVEYQCDTGEARTGRIEGQAEDCAGELGVEVLDDGETVDEVTVEPSGQQWSVGFGEGPGQLRSIPTQGDKQVQVRGPGDEVQAEATLTVSHYLDSPNLDVWRPEYGPETVSVGEPVTVTYSVATFGGGTAFTAALLVDDEAVATREGTVEAGADCQNASGPEYEFTHSFDDSGTYELAGRITVEGSGGGDTKEIGTVTVTE